MVAPLSNPTTPNPNTLMADLRMKSDKQLFDYAQMHKNDPYIFPMAFQESNARKKLRAAAQNTQAPPAPKVVDQNLQEMAQPMPEDQGIAMLPAPNMERLAGGGIVAFDDGGEVRHFDGSRGSFVGTSNAVPPGAIIMGNMYQDPNTGEIKPLPGVNFTPLTQEERNLGNAKLIPSLSDVADYFRNPYNKRQSAIQRKNEAGTEQNKALIERYKSRRSDDQQLASDVAKQNNEVDPSATSVNTPGAGTALPVKLPPTAKPPVADVAKPPAALVNPMAGLPSLKTTAISAEQAKKDAATLSNDAELRSSLAANETFVKGAYDKLLGDYDKKVAEMPEAYKSYEARLQKEEAEAETDKSKALGMSMFKAGLGMMAGTSQYAFENIGKGALVGLEDYQSALKDFKKAQRERNRAFADIEQARLAEKRGDLKTHTELQAKGIEALGMAKNRTVDGIAKIFDVNTRTATGIFETGMKEASQNERSIYSAGVELKKQGMSDTAAMERTKEQVAGSLKATQMNADAFKLPMLYKSVEDSVDKMLQNDINYKTADEATRATMRDAALKKRLLATPGLAQYADATTGGGSAPGLRYNPQTGKIE